jgi:hypothetical protein
MDPGSPHIINSGMKVKLLWEQDVKAKRIAFGEGTTKDLNEAVMRARLDLIRLRGFRDAVRVQMDIVA